MSGEADFVVDVVMRVIALGLFVMIVVVVSMYLTQMCRDRRNMQQRGRNDKFDDTD